MWQNTAIALTSLAAFIAGLRVMRAGMDGLAAGKMVALLQRMVRSPTRGILTGAFVTALLQSSSAITAITVGLVASGSMTFRNAIGVILGSNVGSTVTPQLLSLNLWGLVIPCLLLGIFLFIFARQRWLHWSMALIGFSLIFIALQCLERSVAPLTTTSTFRQTIIGATHHLDLTILIGCLASAMVQSSTAITVMAMAITADGGMTVRSGIALVLGANIGTCVTSVIASIGMSRASKQAALSHVLLNVGGVLLFLPFLSPFAAWLAHSSSNPAQQVANAHTLFNLICTLLLWPFVSPFATLIERLLPNQSET